MKEKYYVVAKTISRWKLDNPLENWLSHKADYSEIWKKLYVLYYRIFDHKYYAGGLKLINKELDKQLPNINDNIMGGVGLSREWLIRDMIYSTHRFGASFTDYFVYKFYDKNVVGREKVNNLRMQYGYCELVNTPDCREIFDNKGKTYEYFAPYFKRDFVSVNDFERDKVKCITFLENHKTFICKPIHGVNGFGINIFRDIAESAECTYQELIKSGAFVLEELIIQSKEMAVLHAESINTLRLATFKIGEDVIVYGAGLRMGTGSAIVDNAGSGGIYCHINHEYGFVDTNAIDKKGHEYSHHPDTNIRFVGWEIPKWKEAVETVTAMAKVVEGATVISWDLALSEKGWCMVEANDVGGPNLLQSNGVGNKLIMQQLIDKYNELKKYNYGNSF